MESRIKKQQAIANLVEVDFSRLEQMFKVGKTDYYTIEAAKIFGISEDQVTKKQRDFAKNARYLEIYSSSTKKVLL